MKVLFKPQILIITLILTISSCTHLNTLSTNRNYNQKPVKGVFVIMMEKKKAQELKNKLSNKIKKVQGSEKKQIKETNKKVKKERKSKKETNKKVRKRKKPRLFLFKKINRKKKVLKETQPDKIQSKENIESKKESKTKKEPKINKLLSLKNNNSPKAKKKIIKNSNLTEYVVKKGDSLWKLGINYNVSTEFLKSLNNLESNLIHVGQVIKVPKVTKVTKVTHKPKSNKKSSDNIKSIKKTKVQSEDNKMDYQKTQSIKPKKIVNSSQKSNEQIKNTPSNIPIYRPEPKTYEDTKEKIELPKKVIHKEPSRENYQIDDLPMPPLPE